MRRITLALFTALSLSLLLLTGCQRKLGWGVILWAQDAAGVPSGAVLPVYALSNIEKKWIAGLTREYRRPGLLTNNIEIPLPQLHLASTKYGAKKWARAEMGEWTQVYAETMQDGLPIRSLPENGSQRVYRLRAGETVKILRQAAGVPAVGASGDALPGEWFAILTEDGTRGYCFSYRLRLFDHSAGILGSGVEGSGGATDAALDAIIARRWSAAEYWDMINDKKLVIEDLEKHWGFSFGEDTGIANIYVSRADRSFRYTGIKSEGPLKWRFEGTSLRFEQTAENQIRVRFNDEASSGGAEGSLTFYALPVRVDRLIADEQARREELYRAFYAKGPAFQSEEDGAIYLTGNHDFIWEDYQKFSPQIIPVSAMGRGKIDFSCFLSDDIAGAFAGVVTFKFATVNGPARDVHFLYSFNESALTLKHARPSTIRERTVFKIEEDAPEIVFGGRHD